MTTFLVSVQFRQQVGSRFHVECVFVCDIIYIFQARDKTDCTELESQLFVKADLLLFSAVAVSVVTHVTELILIPSLASLDIS